MYDHMQYEFKHNFVIMSIVGAILIGSINSTFGIFGFSLCVIGNVYWIWYHKNITMDSATKWVFIAYLIINSMAIINNYFGGNAFFGL